MEDMSHLMHECDCIIVPECVITYEAKAQNMTGSLNLLTS